MQRKVSAMALTHKYDLGTPTNLPSINLSKSLAAIQEVQLYEEQESQDVSKFIEEEELF